MISEQELKELKGIAKDVRINIIKMLTEAGSGHPGGALSAADILTVLYFHKMKHDPKNPKWDERDRFILSKGHGVPAQYVVLAKSGYFLEEELMSLRKINSRLQGHPDRMKLPGLEASTGSLGQGLSIAIGMAIAGKMDKKNYRIYCMIGDGESQAGQIWEAGMCAVKYKLDNLTAILDYNKIQLDDRVNIIMDIEPIKDKWLSFGWDVLEIDGHNIAQIINAFDEVEKVKGKPSIIIANTIKGKGVSFMEDEVGWHGKAPSKEQADQAIKELENIEI
ncbi:transketolase [candidate division KSB1 bacterium]